MDGGAWTDSISFWIACIAFLQPYLIWLYVKLFKTWNLKSFDFERLQVGFNHMGPYVGYLGALVSRNVDSFLYRATCNVARRGGGPAVQLRWLFAREQSIKSSGGEISGKLALGIFLQKNQPQNVDLFFVGNAEEGVLAEAFARLRERWQAFRSELLTGGIPPEQLPLPVDTAFAQDPAYRSFRDELRQRLFWEVGGYDLELQLYFDLREKAHPKTLSIEITPADLARIEAGLEILINSALTGLPLAHQDTFVPLKTGGTVARLR